MKKSVVCLLFLLLLAGCSGAPDEMETALDLRSRLLQCRECSFQTRITADYGYELHQFSMDCRADPGGGLSFTVTEPASIAGLSGKITGEGGQLLFDGTALHFPLLAEDTLSPVSGPWVLWKALCSGYLTAAGTQEGVVLLSVDDSYEEDALRLDIRLDERQLPAHAEILHEGRKIMTLDVTGFGIL